MPKNNNKKKKVLMLADYKYEKAEEEKGELIKERDIDGIVWVVLNYALAGKGYGCLNSTMCKECVGSKNKLDFFIHCINNGFTPRIGDTTFRPQNK